jgi:hypothetical protein
MSFRLPGANRSECEFSYTTVGDLVPLLCHSLSYGANDGHIFDSANFEPDSGTLVSALHLSPGHYLDFIPKRPPRSANQPGARPTISVPNHSEIDIRSLT